MRTLQAVPFQGKGISSPPSASPGGCCADASSRGGEARSCFPTGFVYRVRELFFLGLGALGGEGLCVFLL